MLENFGESGYSALKLALETLGLEDEFPFQEGLAGNLQKFSVGVMKTKTLKGNQENLLRIWEKMLESAPKLLSCFFQKFWFSGKCRSNLKATTLGDTPIVRWTMIMIVEV